MQASYDPTRINAVVLLTDGRNEDGDRNDDNQQLQQPLVHAAAGQRGRRRAAGAAVHRSPTASDADLGTLRAIAEATNAAAYDASDPQTINKVFTAVVSNF